MSFFWVIETDFEDDDSNEDFPRSDPTSKSGKSRSSRPWAEEEKEAVVGSSRSRSVSPLRMPLVDVDPDAVRIALKKFANRLATTEREKVKT